jgi:hypothetical protein
LFASDNISIQQNYLLDVIIEPLPNNISELDFPDNGTYPPVISPDGNYFISHCLSSPISFATGKPIPVRFQSFQSIVKWFKFSCLWYDFTPQENFLAVLEKDQNEIVVLVTELSTGKNIKKISFPDRNDYELDSASIFGFSAIGKNNFIVARVHYEIKKCLAATDKNISKEGFAYANIADGQTLFQHVIINENCYQNINSNDVLLSSKNLQFIMPGNKEPFAKKYILSTHDGKIQGDFPISRADINEISKDGKYVMLSNFKGGSFPYYLHIFDIKTQKKVVPSFNLGWHSFPLNPIGDVKIAMSDNKKLLAIYPDSYITIYDVKTRKIINKFYAKKKGYSDLEFTNQDKYLCIHCENKTRFFDIQTGKELFWLIFRFNKERHWAIVAADGRYDGTKEALDNIKIKPDGLSDTPENYFSPKDKPNFYVDGLLTTFFNVPTPDHYWFKTPKQIQQIINQKQKQQSQQQKPSTLTPISNTKTTIIPLPQIINSK